MNKTRQSAMDTRQILVKTNEDDAQNNQINTWKNVQMLLPFW